MGSARMQESCHEVLVFHTSTCLGVSNRSPRLSLSSPSLSSFSFLGDLASLVGGLHSLAWCFYMAPTGFSIRG